MNTEQPVTPVNPAPQPQPQNETVKKAMGILQRAWNLVKQMIVNPVGTVRQAVAEPDLTLSLTLVGCFALVSIIAMSIGAYRIYNSVLGLFMGGLGGFGGGFGMPRLGFAYVLGLFVGVLFSVVIAVAAWWGATMLAGIVLGRKMGWKTALSLSAVITVPLLAAMAASIILFLLIPSVAGVLLAVAFVTAMALAAVGFQTEPTSAKGFYMLPVTVGFWMVGLGILATILS